MIRWTAPEFIQYKRGKNWYALLVVIALTLAGLAIIYKYWTSLILVLLGLAVIWMRTVKEPRQIHFVLTDQGLEIDNRLHPFTDLQSFWILESFYGRELFLHGKKIFSPRLEIHLGNQDKDKIRDFLLKYLPEKEEEESLVTILARILKI